MALLFQRSGTNAPPRLRELPQMVSLLNSVSLRELLSQNRASDIPISTLESRVNKEVPKKSLSLDQKQRLLSERKEGKGQVVWGRLSNIDFGVLSSRRLAS